MKDAQFINPEQMSLIIDGKSYDIELEPRVDDRLAVRVNGRLVRLNIPGKSKTVKKSESGVLKITAPMPGKIVRVLVKPGDTVEEGQGLLIMEAMKMENELKAPRKVQVTEIRVQTGQSVESGALLLNCI